MPARVRVALRRAGIACCIHLCALVCPAQTQAAPLVTSDSPIQRIAGTEPASHIQYLRLVLKGASPSPANASAKAADPPADAPPLLIAQCTLRPNGKYYFEMFATFGGPADLDFTPPWTPSSPQDLFPPRTQKVTITMEFLGYTHVKPLRRQWEIPVATPDQYRFNAPGGGSANMEDISFDLRYLLALPTLRLTLAKQSAEFLTTPLLDAIRKDTLCKAAGL
jgi:hypothetical protein